MLSGAILAAVVTLQVPFVPQQKDTCGAAALAMVLAYYGTAVSQDEIAALLVEPELGGIRGSRLADFARGRGMVAIAFTGDLALLKEHLALGRPLVVALSAGGGRNHDVVVVGFDEARAELIVNDPALGAARPMGAAEFERRWQKTGRWTLLVQPEAGAGPSAATGPNAAMGPGRQGALLPVLPFDAGYDAVVARAIELSRADQAEEAVVLLDRAVAADPARPEAWAERGGLRFLAARYDEAIADLGRALTIREDAYARNLLAASLQLAGREQEALSTWNRLGQPILGRVEITGLRATHDPVARREIGLEPGALVTPGALRAARRRLGETGVFEKVTLRAKPLGDGRADLEVALSERHGFAQGPLDFLVTTGVGLAWRRVRLRYANLGGTGVSLGGSWRWQENRPETALEMSWPRPLGLPVYLALGGSRGEQVYQLGGSFAIRHRGFALSTRQVVGKGALVAVGLRLSERTVSQSRPDAEPGRIVALDLRFDGRILETRRQRFEGGVKLTAADRALASEIEYLQGEAELRYQGIASRPEGRSVERSVIAARLRGGWGSGGLPVDEMYALGVSFDSDIPLRAHALTRHGVIGGNPVGRAFVLLNAEWRQRLLHKTVFDFGMVAFADLAGVSRPAQGSRGGTFCDVGVGLRLALLGGATLRVDQAWGLSDGRRALFVGLGEAF